MVAPAIKIDEKRDRKVPPGTAHHYILHQTDQEYSQKRAEKPAGVTEVIYSQRCIQGLYHARQAGSFLRTNGVDRAQRFAIVATSDL